jgi:chromosome segregation ATPase
MMIESRMLVAAAALCAAIVSVNAEAKLYKWVDKNGQTHYGETIPPEYANRDTKTLDKGRVLDRQDGFDKAQQEESKVDPEVAKAAREAKRRDEALLNTYSSEKEIDLARDRNLLQIEARVNSYTTMLKSAKDSLDSLYKERDDLTKQGRKIQQSLTEEITEGEALVAKRQKELDTNLKQMEEVKARYEADKQRYRELKGIEPRK